MTELVNPTQIEEIVGVKRDPVRHYGRVITDTQTFYILHSKECVDSGIDLRECPYSKALDTYGIDEDFWLGYTNVPITLVIEWGILTPITRWAAK